MSRESIFDWKALPDWSETISGFIPAILQAEVLSRVTESSDQFRFRDDTYEFEKLYREIADFDSLINFFVDEFPRHFPYLRMYHCCRPVDPTSYYKSGMLMLDLSVANRAFAERYRDNPQFPKITETQLSDTFASMADSHGREGLIYFGLDDRYLVKHCPHYLTHGSEYNQGLAVHLEKLTGYDIKADLMQRGRPTVFCVRMPVERIDDDSLQELGRDAFHAWAFGLAHATTIPWENGFAVDTDVSLPSEFIIEHYAPVAKDA